MCVAFFALDHPEYALVLCANRDEYLARPTQPAHFTRHVLAGVDLQAGGTWLGLTRTGKLGLLTNITEDTRATFPSSRGHLVAAYLASPSTHPLEDDVRRIVPPDASYAGFNLVLFAPTPSRAFDALYVTNHGAGGPITYRPLTEAQRHRGGVSNGIDGNGADAWPKLQHGRAALAALLERLPPDTSDDQLTEQLLDLLTWRSSQPPRDRLELRHTIQVDPICVANGVYGTRLSTVVLVRRNGQVVFTERDRWMLSDQGQSTLADPSSQRVFRFDIENDDASKRRQPST